MLLEESNLVSVIMACYNEDLNLIKKSIESVINQTHLNIEFIIVCDNPKNEDIRNLLIYYSKLDSRIRVIFNEKNKGLIESLNTALNIAKGNFIARMDADDICMLNRIETQLEYLLKNNFDFVMSKVIFIDELGNKIFNKKNENIKEDRIKKYLMYRNISFHPTWLFKKSVLEKNKKYNQIIYAEDYDFICRVILNGFSIGYIDSELLYYRIRSTGITKSNRYYQEIVTQIVSKCYTKALKNGFKYNPSEYLKKISDDEIEKFKTCNSEFKKGKDLINEKHYATGSFKVLKVLFKSRIKRTQLIDHLRLKLSQIIN